MRPSSRTAILDAAFRLAGNDDGAVEITFDATAKEAGVTKGGVLYHFRTRQELVLAVVEYAAQRLEEAMLARVGKPFEETTAAERVRAYVSVIAAGRLTRADLAVYTEGLADPAYCVPWEMTLHRWLSLDDVTDPAERARLRIAQLAADGLWSAEATDVFAPAKDRDAVIAQLIALTETPTPETPSPETPSPERSPT
ncbi:TetR family transcriptional regulator [Kribbella sp. VKM Ac-2527]|uniref:TetR family transcriptional regulator n=1 Tax=Kribbella caucasensis TaxID=2512215 RepID=A0A4R6K5U2_9ACTN|nr:TetR/AcrR family transcriptional regulator [Kribbella sp. VKM Ac-2527]TDO44723.1 TetR family transcriptional regulator [Kribbella sp. VKM Ac-2527]